MKDRREELELTRTALAAKLGISASAVEQWENRDVVPPLDRIEALAAALDIPVHVLITEQLESEEPPGNYHITGGPFPESTRIGSSGGSG